MRHTELDRTRLALRNLDSIRGILEFARLKLNDTLQEEVLPSGEFDKERNLVKMMHDKINEELEYNLASIEESLKIKSQSTLHTHDRISSTL